MMAALQPEANKNFTQYCAEQVLHLSIAPIRWKSVR